jgi:hypothetical protein
MTNKFKILDLNNYDYNKVDNNKNNGLITKIWGEHAWEFFHCVAFGYPIEPTQEQKEQYKIFFTNIQYVLPCRYCRESYGNFITTEDELLLTDKDLENRDSLTRWTFRLHNRVNKKLGIDYKLTYDDFVEKYESYRAKCVPGEKGCNMPLDLKANSYFYSKIQQAPVITEKRYFGFKEYAKKRGVIFNDNILGLLNLDRYDNAWILRDKKCRQILNYMRLNGISQIEKEGIYKNLPTIQELKLLSLLCSDICCEELDIMIENINKLL